MRIVTPSSLKWLINKRARLSGEINNIELWTPSLIEHSKNQIESSCQKLERLLEVHDGYKAALDRLPTLKKNLEAIDIALGLHKVQIDKTLISPIRPKAAKIKKAGIPWGGLTRAIFECLRLSGTPVTTTGVALFVMKKYAIEYDSFVFIEISQAARNRMRSLALAGKLERLHSLNNAEEGIWKIPSHKPTP